MDDVNYLIGLQYQMGEDILSKVFRSNQNMSKCLKWNDVKASYMSQDLNVLITFEDISGLLLVLAVGLIAAMTIMSIELVAVATKRQIKTRPSASRE